VGGFSLGKGPPGGKVLFPGRGAGWALIQEKGQTVGGQTSPPQKGTRAPPQAPKRPATGDPFLRKVFGTYPRPGGSCYLPSREIPQKKPSKRGFPPSFLNFSGIQHPSSMFTSPCKPPRTGDPSEKENLLCEKREPRGTCSTMGKSHRIPLLLNFFMSLKLGPKRGFPPEKGTHHNYGGLLREGNLPGKPSPKPEETQKKRPLS